ncbi:MAG TPA: histidine kinase [Bryobacteraceae bacterium]|nr:histidine kinase [Bryobacteraceae bacterium]
MQAIFHARGSFLHACRRLLDPIAQHRYAEDALHGISGANVTADLIGHTTGLLITLVLLVLTLRAAKLPGTPVANIIFAICGLLWSAGGLVTAASLGSGIPQLRGVASIAVSVQYTGAAAFPIAFLAIWRRFAIQDWQKKAARILNIIAIASTAAIVFSLWLQLFPLNILTSITAHNAGILLVVGPLVSLRRGSTPRSVYLPSIAILCAVVAIGIAGIMGWHSQIHGHLVLLMMVFAFLLFARFRYADLFIRFGVRILLASVWAFAIVIVAQSAFVFHVVNQMSSPAAMHVFLVLITATGLLLSFTFVDDRISALVARMMFRAPDYREAARQFTNRVRDLHGESEILAALEEAARTPLGLEAARVLSFDGLPWPKGIADGEITEIDYRDPLCKLLPVDNVEILVPITFGGRVSHVLAIAPGTERPSLVTRHLNYLQTIAAQCGYRLDALRREEEVVERQSREALLLQQVTEAELRALRAQINPHFLFNCLNTIADLVVRSPSRAETMILRLAEVFRHVLDHSNRPLTSIRDEIEFLRTYLSIEEARFGDRLQVKIDVAPEVEGAQIPSLILQPLVENALKHGLGPKPGPGHLAITVRADGDNLQMTVEDDGMGPSAHPGKGLGLANIAERLQTLYQDRASVSLRRREGGGSVATVVIPCSKEI